MAPIRVGIDLGQSPVRVGALVLSKYMVVHGEKAVKVNGPEAHNRLKVVEVFKDVVQVTKSYFGSPNFQGAVVVVPNGTSYDNEEAVTNAAGASYNIMEVIHENTAVAAAFAEIVRPTVARRLAIVSVTAGVLDVSIFKVISNEKFVLEEQETHPEPIELEESSHSGGGGGVFGLVSGAIGGAVKALVVDPLENLLGIAHTLLSSPKLAKEKVDDVVFVGKASESEKLKQAVKERFPAARVWSPEDIEAEELAAYGAGMIAYKQLDREKREPEKSFGSDGDSLSGKNFLSGCRMHSAS